MTFGGTTLDDDPELNRLRTAGAAKRRELIAALVAHAATLSNSDPGAAIAAWEEARGLIEHLDGRTGEWRTYTRYIANARERRHDLQGAATAYDEAKPPDDAAARELYSWANGRAMLAERLNEWHYATVLYDIVVREFGKLAALREPCSPFGLSNAAVWAAECGDGAKADRLLSQFKAAIASVPDNDVTYEVPMMEAQIAAASGDLARANAAWLEVAEIAGRTDQTGLLSSIAEIRSEILRTMGRVDDAIALLRPIVTGPSGDAADGYPSHQMAAAVLFGEMLAGIAAKDEGARTEARDVLRRALAGEIARGMPEAEWRLLGAFAELCAANSDPRAAILFGKLAVDVIARLKDFAPLRPATVVPDIERRLAPHRRLFDRLVEAGRFPEAAYVQEMRKGEAAIELVRRDAVADDRQKTVPWQPAEASVANGYLDIAARARQANTRAQGISSDPETGKASLAVEQARRHAVRWADHLLDGALKSVVTAEATRDSALAKPSSDTLALHFLQAPDGWRVLARTAQREFDYRVDGVPAAIARSIFDFRKAIVEQSPRWQSYAVDLFERLLRPVDPMLAAVSQVVVSSESPLGYLPFSALHDGEQCFAERVAILMTTGLAPQKHKPRREPVRRALLFGSEGEGRDTIAFVGAELDAICKLHPSARRITPFTAETFAAALSEGADIVHIASHFHLEPARPGRSYLALDDEVLTLDRFRMKRFPLSDTALLVLSACETAVEDHGPFGLESFAGLAQAKGARHVLGTLWRVADASAASFMAAFYDRLGGDRCDSTHIAGAVRQAQMRMIAGAGAAQQSNARGGLSLPPPSSWRHPYHWAGYVLYG